MVRDLSKLKAQARLVTQARGHLLKDFRSVSNISQRAECCRCHMAVKVTDSMVTGPASKGPALTHNCTAFKPAQVAREAIVRRMVS